jgi:hypothetical protein
MFLPLKVQRAHFLVRPWLSLVLVVMPVNKETQTLVNVMEKGMPSPGFSLCIEKTLNLYNPAQEPYRACACRRYGASQNFARIGCLLIGV